MYKVRGNISQLQSGTRLNARDCEARETLASHSRGGGGGDASGPQQGREEEEEVGEETLAGHCRVGRQRWGRR